MGSVGVLGVIFIALSVLCVIFLGITGLIIEPNAMYKYNNEVHSHLENAYWAADPVTMRAEMVTVKQNMVAIGLTPDMYNVWIPWDKTADHQMAWQYKHIDSIITRIDEFTAWEKANGEQQLSDVYTAKLNNIRHFMSPNDGGTWSDDIARGAYLINYQFGIVIMSVLGLLGIIFFLVVGWICIGLD